VPLAYLQVLCRYWARTYDWRTVEARLNAVPRYRTVIDGLGIHFLHVRSPDPPRCRWLVLASKMRHASGSSCHGG
jgi:hypothetical protein